MIRLIEEFRFGVVTRVYPVRRCEPAIMTGFSLGGEQFVK
jgi:hypothetical protein